MSVSTSIELSPAAGAVGSASDELPQFLAAPPTAASSGAASAPDPVSNSRTSGTAEPAAAPTAGAVSDAAREISSYLSSSKTNIAFALDQSSGDIVVRITDSTTGQTIRQIPSEVVLRIAQELKQNKKLDSLQLDEKA